MLVLAHRGFHARHAENTLDAFGAALECGADGFETDVRLSRDGQALLIHDRVVPTRADAQRRPVAELTRREVEQALAHHVPLLAEAIECFPDAYWNIEIKSPDALAETVRVLKQHCGRVRLLVTSFRHDVVARCAEVLDVDCGLLVAHRPLDVGTLIAPCASLPRMRSIVWDYNILDEVMVWEAQAAGWGSHVYGAVTGEEHAHCVRLELESLITDYPELARP